MWVLLAGSVFLNAYLIIRLQVVTKERDGLEREKAERREAAKHLKLVTANKLVDESRRRVLRSVQ